eukprot:6593788-Alexandrium_andersonii.AAC.1
MNQMNQLRMRSSTLPTAGAVSLNRRRCDTCSGGARTMTTCVLLMPLTPLGAIRLPCASGGPLRFHPGAGLASA